MGTNYTQFLADIFLYEYEAGRIQKMYLKKIIHSLWPSTQHSDISTTYYLLSYLSRLERSSWALNKRYQRIFFIFFLLKILYWKGTLMVYVTLQEKFMINMMSSFFYFQFPHLCSNITSSAYVVLVFLVYSICKEKIYVWTVFKAMQTTNQKSY